MTTAEIPLDKSLADADVPPLISAPPEVAVRTAAHLYQLDVLRAVAILMVFGFHVYAMVFPSFGDHSTGLFFDYGNYTKSKPFWLFHLFRYGGAGVPFFFVLSGFCIQLAQIRAETKAQLSGGENRFDLITFVCRRFWRIYPAYLFALVFAIGLKYFRGNLLPAEMSAMNVITHVLMLHNFVADHVFAYNAAFWSLAVEWQFYLVFPLVLWLRGKWGSGGLLVVAAIVSIISRIALVAAGVDWESYLWFLPTISWVEWCLGVWLADRYVSKQPSLTGRGYFIPIALLVLCLATGQLVSSPMWLRTLWAIFFAAVLERYLRRTTVEPSMVERSMIPIGLCSYSLYLLHMPVIALLLSIGRKSLGPNVWRELIIGFAVALPISLIMSWVSFKWIELPFSRIGKRASIAAKPATSS